MKKGKKKKEVNISIFNDMLKVNQHDKDYLNYLSKERDYSIDLLNGFYRIYGGQVYQQNDKKEDNKSQKKRGNNQKSKQEVILRYVLKKKKKDPSSLTLDIKIDDNSEDMKQKYEDEELIEKYMKDIEFQRRQIEMKELQRKKHSNNNKSFDFIKQFGKGTSVHIDKNENNEKENSLDTFKLLDYSNKIKSECKKSAKVMKGVRRRYRKLNSQSSFDKRIVLNPLLKNDIEVLSENAIRTKELFNLNTIGKVNLQHKSELIRNLNIRDHDLAKDNIEKYKRHENLNIFSAVKFKSSIINSLHPSNYKENFYLPKIIKENKKAIMTQRNEKILNQIAKETQDEKERFDKEYKKKLEIKDFNKKYQLEKSKSVIKLLDNPIFYK